MSKTLRTVGMVAGLVALAATGVGAIAAAGGATALAAGSVAGYASAAAAIANIGALATAKTPPARGSVSGITIGGDQPTPILIGETYYGGSRQYQDGYGPTLDKVPNPYAFIVDVYSGAGPVDGVVDYLADFAPLGIPPAGGAATGYAGGFLWAGRQLGAVPEGAALSPRYAGAPNWGAAYKLSGKAAIGWSLLFDRKGKVFASGVPQLGAIWRGVRVYDPRLDGTYPGGIGPQRIDDETTWAWSENPGLHGLAYAYGRYQRAVKVAGVGIPADGLNLEDFVHLANVCDANGWKVGGVVFEPATGAASSRWQNLKDILAAGGAEPCFRGGRLGLKVSAPRLALDTITEADLADDDIVTGAMQGWEGRLNTLIPKYRSRDHKWEYVQSTAPVTIASYVAEDGEVKREERQFNLVQHKDQAAQLCAYELLDRRELGDIEIVCKPRLRRYGPGDLLIVDIKEAGLIAQPCVILKRTLDPATMTVRFVMRGETPAKHAFALGQVGVAPPTPAIRSTADLDGIAAPIVATRGAYQLIGFDEAYPVSTTTSTIAIAAFRGTLDTGRIVDFPASEITGLTDSASYIVVYALADVEQMLVGDDGQTSITTVPAGTYVAAPAPALEYLANQGWAVVQKAITASPDGTYPPEPTPPGGYGGGGYGGGGRYQPTVQQE